MLGSLWQRFLWLSWINKALVVAVLIYASGWLVGNLGLNGMARELGGVALYVAAFPITAIIIRGMWRFATAHHRK